MKRYPGTALCALLLFGGGTLRAQQKAQLPVYREVGALRKPLFPEPQPLGAVVLARREPARLPCGLRHPPGRPAQCGRILENQRLRSRNLRTAAVRQGDLLRQHRLQRRQGVCPALELDASGRRRQSFHPRRFDPVGFQHPTLQPERNGGLQAAGAADSRPETRLRHRQFGQPDRPEAQNRRACTSSSRPASST